VRFASDIACLVWVVSLAGFFEGEHPGIHTIQDSRKIVFSDADADADADGDSDHQVLSGTGAPGNPTDAVVFLPEGSAIPSLPRPSPLRNRTGQILPAVSQLIAKTVLRL
jgi:hypothetical protein